MSDSEPKVVIATCPTGGWVFGNRKRIEAEVLKKMPNAKIEHQCACLLTTVLSVNGKQGKRDCCPMMFACPSCFKCCSAEKYATDAYLPPAASGGSPEAVEMFR